MNCEVLSLAGLVESPHTALFVRNHLTRPGSDFQKKLTCLLLGDEVSERDGGHIALAIDQGEIVGWARTEYWTAGSDGAGGFVSYDTLEAFVAEGYRLRGVASFAASGLYASVLHDEGGTVAVFAPKMLLVARRAGFWPVLFEKVDGKWVRA